MTPLGEIIAMYRRTRCRAAPPPIWADPAFFVTVDRLIDLSDASPGEQANARTIMHKAMLRGHLQGIELHSLFDQAADRMARIILDAIDLRPQDIALDATIPAVTVHRAIMRQAEQVALDHASLLRFSGYVTDEPRDAGYRNLAGLSLSETASGWIAALDREARLREERQRLFPSLGIPMPVRRGAIFIRSEDAPALGCAIGSHVEVLCLFGRQALVRDRAGAPAYWRASEGLTPGPART